MLFLSVVNWIKTLIKTHKFQTSFKHAVLFVRTECSVVWASCLIEFFLERSNKLGIVFHTPEIDSYKVIRRKIHPDLVETPCVSLEKVHCEQFNGDA